MSTIQAGGNGGDDPRKSLAILIVMFALMCFLLLMIGRCNAQEQYPSLSNYTYSKSQLELLGASCASPDGSDKQIWHTPLNYKELLDSGYCYAVVPASKNVTGCFTLTSPGTSVNFNTGYSVSGCATIGVNYARLYTSAPGCVLVNNNAIGTIGGLTAGQAYTWCISLTCSGPGPGFDHLCPWYEDMTILPVDLLEFYCEQGSVYWSTASEIGGDYFILEGSTDAKDWLEIKRIKCEGITGIVRYTQKVTDFEYYRLKEVDYDYHIAQFKPIKCDNFEDNRLDDLYDVFSVNGTIIMHNMKSFLITHLIASNGLYLVRNNRNGKTNKILIKNEQ